MESLISLAREKLKSVKIMTRKMKCADILYGVCLFSSPFNFDPDFRLGFGEDRPVRGLNEEVVLVSRSETET
jgi:hypothetical protein